MTHYKSILSHNESNSIFFDNTNTEFFFRVHRASKLKQHEYLDTARMDETCGEG